MKLRLKTVIVIAMLVSIHVSCKKEQHKPHDFREKFIGQYQVKETIWCYGSCNTCYSQKDTIIAVSIGQTDSTLLILGREVFLDSNGNYYAYHYGLRLWNDSIRSMLMSGGLGCGTYVKHEGVNSAVMP